MSLTISVYSKQSFKEFLLPSLVNADYSIVLEKEFFELEKNLRLNLEILDGIWKLKKHRSYSFAQDGDSSDLELHDSDFVKVSGLNGQVFYLFVRETESPFHVYDKYSLKNLKQPLLIGRDKEKCGIVYDFAQYVARSHAEIRMVDHTCILKGLSSNPTYVNETLVSENSEHQLKFGDVIHIFGLHMVYLGGILAIDNNNEMVTVKEEILAKYEPEDLTSFSPRKLNKLAENLFHRSPRAYIHLDDGSVDIEDPPLLERYSEQPLSMVLGPSITMALPMILGCALMMSGYSRSGLAMYSGLVMSVSSAILGVYWGWKNITFQRREAKKNEEERFEAYSEYIVEKTEEIRDKYENTLQILGEKYPAAKECAKYNRNSIYLWNRNTSHKDFLTHRLGTGDVPFQVHINVSKKRFHLRKDELMNKPLEVRNEYDMLYNVPITIDLSQKNLIGLIGGKDKKGALEVAKALSVQIASGNCYTDVKLGYIFDAADNQSAEAFSAMKWIPHVWSNNKKVRFISDGKENSQEVFYELTNTFRNRLEDPGAHKDSSGFPKPYYIIFVSDLSQLEGEALSKYLLGKNELCGLTTILLCESYEELPNSCDYIIQNDENYQGIYHVSDQENEKIRVAFDSVSDEEVDVFAHGITSLRVQEVESGGEIPNSLTFFEMCGITRPEDYPVKDLWAKNKIYENIKGLVGQLAGGKNCYLDVHEKYHGPHGLVAGTTGSGKSETLQTYILSLAMNYSPDDIGFFIIDYKGGGMANLFDGLPHMIGAISNLSGNHVYRAMVSIKSENRRRQRVFSENGVNNINAYTKLYKNGEATIPIPHLFIIIDEFAELKREEPEFMKELISVAQVGRSLGVHLVLATQKPSGTVDDNIWSNSKFRLCLRVQDRQDSMDMLHKPDAAYITQAGRAYLQVGNDEIYEQFQSGYSGAIYDESMNVGSTDIARLIRLDGTVELTGDMAKTTMMNKVQYRWISQLVSFVDAAMAENGLTFDGLEEEEDVVNKLIPSLFNNMWEGNVDYPENRFNQQRLVEFVLLYKSVAQEEVDNPVMRILERSSKEKVKLPEQKEHTQLDAVKEHLAIVAKENGYTYEQLLWLPVLPTKMCVEDLTPFTKPKSAADMGNVWSLPVTIGLLDDPANQSQPVFVLDFAKDENVAVCGSIASGKSTMMQSIAYSLIRRYDADVVNLYILDFSTNMMSALEHAPHVQDIFYESDTDKMDAFFSRMNMIMEERKEMLRGGSFSQYIQKNGMSQPAIVLFIDNFASFNEKTNNMFEDDLIRLSKEGLNLGIYLVVSGAAFNMNDIISRVADNLRTVLCLQMSDKYMYSDLLHTMQIDVMPETNVKGRGLARYEDRILEFQACQAIAADNDYQRMELMKAECMAMAGIWEDAEEEMEQPQKKALSYQALEVEYAYQQAIKNPGLLPVGFCQESQKVYSIPLKDTLCYLVTGEDGKGKTNFMRTCIMSAMKKGGEVVVIDSMEDPVYGEFYGNPEITYIDDPEVFFNFLNPRFLSEFTRRNGLKKEIYSVNEDWDEVFDVLKEEPPYFIFIADFKNFIALMEQTIEGEEMRARLPEIIASYMKYGACHNIYFFAEVAPETEDDVSSDPMFYEFSSHQCGIRFGGECHKDSFLDYTYMSVTEQLEEDPEGLGSLSKCHYDLGETGKIVIPLTEVAYDFDSDL